MDSSNVPLTKEKMDSLNVPLTKGDAGGFNFEAELLVPEKKLYCTDNAAMIGVAGLLK